MKERSLPGRILVVTAGLTGRQAMDLMQQGVAGIFPRRTRRSRWWRPSGK